MSQSHVRGGSPSDRRRCRPMAACWRAKSKSANGRNRNADRGSKVKSPSWREDRCLRFLLASDSSDSSERKRRARGFPLPPPSGSSPAEAVRPPSAGSTVSYNGSYDETNVSLAAQSKFRDREATNAARLRNGKPDSDQPMSHNITEDENQAVHRSLIGHNRVSRIPTPPPTRDVQTYNSNVSSTGNLYSRRQRTQAERSPFSKIIDYSISSLPVNSRTPCIFPESQFGKKDSPRISPHPLPLPPGSPISSRTNSLHSKWKKGKLIGRGTFGRVYLGFNRGGGQMCAIKEVDVVCDDPISKECLRQLSQEINLLRQLWHPNIVQYYGCELMDGTLSVYLEYVPGGSIHKLLQDFGPFPESVIRSYAAQILSGLAYLHEKNVLHRDIKGANILVDPNGEIKLADFGVAKHTLSYSSIHSLKGSPYWMAPEVIMNTNGYSLPVDIWSLGCTIIEMATSKPPWNQHSGVQALFKIGHSKEIPVIPDHISDDGKHFLKLCLQRNPLARPAASELMNHPFVRNQLKPQTTQGNLGRDAYQSLFNEDHSSLEEASCHLFSSTKNKDGSYKRGGSPLGDRHWMIHTIGSPSTYINSSASKNLKMNMSSPTSPCSSPLRQLNQPNSNCSPSSPNHQEVKGHLGNCSLSSPNHQEVKGHLANSGIRADTPFNGDISPNGVTSPLNEPSRVSSVQVR